MAEERIRKDGSDKPEQGNKDSSKGQRELTPEQLEGVSGGQAMEPHEKAGSEETAKRNT